MLFSFWNVLAMGECRIGTRVSKWNKGGDCVLLLSADFQDSFSARKIRED